MGPAQPAVLLYVDRLICPVRPALEQILALTQKELHVVLGDQEVDRTVDKYYGTLRIWYRTLANLALESGKHLLDFRLYFVHWSSLEFLDRLQPSTPLMVLGRGSTLPKKLQSFKAIRHIEPSLEVPVPVPSKYTMCLQRYRHVAIGGTFDRLHSGHKLMLSLAALLASSKIVCGVTDVNMLVDKQFSEKIESLHQRAARVKRFLKAFAPESVAIEVITLRDPFGPTTTDPTLDALIVSTETTDAGYKINRIRKDCGMPELDVISIDLIEISVAGLEDKKLSSTLLRSLDQ